ncbi:54S ribosomal protein L32 [Mactra antiquata]
MLAARIQRFINDFRTVVQRICVPGHTESYLPALCCTNDVTTSSPKEFRPADLFPSIVFAVPRNRRSLQKRQTRRNVLPDMANARVKKNIVICLNCGKPHERETICGNCYKKVKAETERMRGAMDQDDYYYNHPRQEVGYLYKGESTNDIPMYKGRYLVEIDDERPDWFSFDKLKKDKKGDK